MYIRTALQHTIPAPYNLLYSPPLSKFLTFSLLIGFNTWDFNRPLPPGRRLFRALAGPIFTAEVVTTLSEPIYERLNCIYDVGKKLFLFNRNFLTLPYKFGITYEQMSLEKCQF